MKLRPNYGLPVSPGRIILQSHTNPPSTLPYVKDRKKLALSCQDTEVQGC
jgi:hypothetical protein